MDTDQSVASLSQDKMQKVSSFRVTANVQLAQESLPSMTVAQAVKFLYASKFNEKKAEDIFIKYQKFHKQFSLSDLLAQKQTLNAEIRSKKLEILGARDNDGAQILLFTVSRHDSRSCDLKTAVQLLFLLLNQISESQGTQSKGVTLLIDLQGCSQASCDVKYISTVLSILDGGYPLYLHMVYILEAPLWLKLNRESVYQNLMKSGKVKGLSLADLSLYITPIPPSLSGSINSSKSAATAAAVSGGISAEIIHRNKSPPKLHVGTPPVAPPPRIDKLVKKQHSVPATTQAEEEPAAGTVNKMKDLFQATPISPPPPPIKPQLVTRGKVSHVNGIHCHNSNSGGKPVKTTGPAVVPLKPRAQAVEEVSTGAPPTQREKNRVPILPPPTRQKPAIAHKPRLFNPSKNSDIDEHVSGTGKSAPATSGSATSFSAEEVLLPLDEEMRSTIDQSNKSHDDMELPTRAGGGGASKSKGMKLINSIFSRPSQDSSESSSQGGVTKASKGREKKTEPDKNASSEKEALASKKSGHVPVRIGDTPTKAESVPKASAITPQSKPARKLLPYDSVSVKPTRPIERINNKAPPPQPLDPSPASSDHTPNKLTQPYKVTVISSSAPPTTAAPPPPTQDMPEYAVIRKPHPPPAATPAKAVSPPPSLPPHYKEEDIDMKSDKPQSRGAYENIFFMNADTDEDEGEILGAAADGKSNGEVIYENFGPDRGNRWMTTGDLRQYINEKGHKELSLEYFKIKNEPLLDTFEHFKLSCNTSKNRYKDVVCYDSTRVKLAQQPDTEGSDYIHANYINGYQKPKAIILTQGPLKRTVNDYWRLLWEKKVFVIVMATKCVEVRKLKCAQYWPDGTAVATFGDITVRVVEDQVKDGYQFRQFQASRNGVTRSLMHYQFLAWPDYGVPSSGTEVLDVLCAARAMQERYSEHVGNPDQFPLHGPPMVIHCSAGIGRSGTFCALDYCIDELRMTNKVNVQKCVRLLRQQRAYSIQTDEQYMFCYKTVLEYGLYLEAALKR